MERIFIAICNSQDFIYEQFFWSMMGALQQCNFPFLVYRAGHPWDVVRNNQAIDSFLKSGWDIFAKCDLDQAYPQNYFSDMVPLVEEYKVIGPVIFDRHSQNNYVTLCWKTKTPWIHTNIDLIDETGIKAFPYTHTNNFYAREVLEKCERPWYQADLRHDGLERDNHVDYDFLDRVKAAGYEIYTNCDIVVEHLGYIPLNRKTVRKLRK